MKCQYHECSNEITGHRTKFCSETCQIKNHMLKRRKPVKEIVKNIDCKFYDLCLDKNAVSMTEFNCNGCKKYFKNGSHRWAIEAYFK